MSRNVRDLLAGSLQVWLVIFLAPAGVFSHDQPASPQTRTLQRYELRKPVADFALVDQAARGFKFQSLRGKVAIVAFTYTTCPDVCPLITATMRLAQAAMTEEENRSTHFITVTTDPEIDTPGVLAAYARRYQVDLSNWTFLTGGEKALQKVWKSFGVGVHKKARGLIDHTTLTAIVDGAGTMRIAYSNMPPDAKVMLKDVRVLLRRK